MDMTESEAGKFKAGVETARRSVSTWFTEFTVLDDRTSPSCTSNARLTPEVPSANPKYRWVDAIVYLSWTHWDPLRMRYPNNDDYVRCNNILP